MNDIDDNQYELPLFRDSIIEAMLTNPTEETLVREGIRAWNASTGSNLVVNSNVQNIDIDMGNWVNSETWSIEVEVEYESVRKNVKRLSRKQVWAKLIDEQIGRFCRAVNSLGIEGVFCTSFKNRTNKGKLHLNLKNPMPIWKMAEYIDTTDENLHPKRKAHRISLYSNYCSEVGSVTGDGDSFHSDTKPDNDVECQGGE